MAKHRATDTHREAVAGFRRALGYLVFVAGFPLGISYGGLQTPTKTLGGQSPCDMAPQGGKVICGTVRVISAGKRPLECVTVSRLIEMQLAGSPKQQPVRIKLATTNMKGEYVIPNLKTDNIQLVFEKKRYRSLPTRHSIVLASDRTTHDVAMIEENPTDPFQSSRAIAQWVVAVSPEEQACSNVWEELLDSGYSSAGKVYFTQAIFGTAGDAGRATLQADPEFEAFRLSDAGVVSKFETEFGRMLAGGARTSADQPWNHVLPPVVMEDIGRGYVLRGGNYEDTAWAPEELRRGIHSAERLKKTYLAWNGSAPEKLPEKEQ